MADEDEMLRGVYPECNEWAQHDNSVVPSCHAERSEASLSSGVSCFATL